MLMEKSLAAMRNTKQLPYMKLDNYDQHCCMHNTWMEAFSKANCLLGL